MSGRKVNLYLVRHGHTIWNETGRYQGHADIPLSSAGREAVRATAERLSGIKFDAIYASDLSRARETAQILLEHLCLHGVEIIYRKDLREMNFGEWDGLTYSQILARWGSLITSWLADPRSVVPPGGERVEDFEARVLAGLSEIVAGNAGGNVMVVTHGGVIAVAYAWFHGVDYRRLTRLPVDPAGWLKFTCDPSQLPPAPSQRLSMGSSTGSTGT